MLAGLNGARTIFSRSITGLVGCALQKIGGGTWTLNGTNLFPGTTTVQAGTLLVNGLQNSGGVVVQSGAFLGGNGTVGAINVIGGGTVVPGSSPGRISSGSASFNANSQLQLELNGPTVATDYDQLNVTGTVNLSGSKLNVSLGFTAVTNSTFVIVQNDGVDPVFGTFAGLSDNSVFAVGGGIFRINLQRRHRQRRGAHLSWRAHPAAA